MLQIFTLSMRPSRKEIFMPASRDRHMNFTDFAASAT